MPSTNGSDYLKPLYQRLGALYGLESRSVLVTKILLLNKWSKILHLHWIEFMYIRKPVVFLSLSSMLTIITLFVLKKLFRIKIVITLHNVIPHEIFSWPIEYVFFKAVLALSDKIFVHSDYASKVAKSLYDVSPTKIVKVFHPSWIEVYANTMPKKKARELLKIPYSGFVFGFFGEVRKYKGVHLLLKAFQGLRIENTWLIIAGAANPRYLAELRKIVSHDDFLTSHVIMVPRRIKREEVQVYVKVCDVGVVPYTETFSPASLLLFMSFGIPVIAPKLPSVMEYCPKEASFFFKSNDLIDLQRTMELAVKSKSKLLEFGLRARDEMRKLTWNKLARATYESYTRLSATYQSINGDRARKGVHELVKIIEKGI